MGFAELAAVAERGIGAWLGEPTQATLPAGCPVSVFVCPVRLPAGCKPPPSLPCRVGAGSALDASTARGLCLLEGTERYSLQFRSGDPEDLTAAAMPGATRASRPIDRLRLGYGAPRDDAVAADSRGCSIGAGLADAALRGLVELAEHDALEIWRQTPDRFQEVDPLGLSGGLDGLIAWLRSKALELRIFEHRHRSGAIAYIAVCSSADKRPAIGSAAGLAARAAAVHACLESAVTWFNLAEIEKNRRRIGLLSPEDRISLDAYRGIAPGPGFPQGRAAPLPPIDTAVSPQEEPETAFERMLDRWGIDVAVFDLSRPETGIVTARVVPLAESRTAAGVAPRL